MKSLLLCTLFWLVSTRGLVEFNDTLLVNGTTLSGDFISFDYMDDAEASRTFQDLYVCNTGNTRDEAKLKDCQNQTQSQILWAYNATDVSVNNAEVQIAPVEVLLVDHYRVAAQTNASSFPLLIDVGSAPQKLFEDGAKASVEHVRIFNCWILEDRRVQDLILTILWVLLFVLWMVNTHCVNKHHATFLQKMLFLVPLFAMISYVFQSIEFFTCPSIFQTVYYYIQMVLMATSILYSSLLVGLLMLISTGWTVVKENITRSQLTTIIMLMGVTYVVQSATAVAGDMKVVKYIVYPIQDVVYVLIFVLIFVNMRRNLAYLREWRRMDEIRNNLDLRVSVVKKIKLLVWLLLLITLYFCQFICSDILTLTYVKSDFQRSVNRYIVNGFVQLALIAAILFFMRAKEEVRFFSLAFNRLGQERPMVAPLYKVELSPKVRKDSSMLESLLQKNAAEVAIGQPVLLIYPSLSETPLTKNMKIMYREQLPDD